MKLLLVALGRYRVVAACSGRGKCQLLAFFSELEGALREQADRMLSLLEEVAEKGPPRNSEVCHWIEKNIWQFEEGMIRVLWFHGGHYEGLPNIVCSQGFKKDSKRTPTKQKDLVKRVRRQYLKDLRKRSIEIFEAEEVQGGE
jgi:hypothetical protein